MAEFPDLLINPNPNAPSLDLSANQVRGLGFFNTTSERDALSVNVRVLGHLAVIKSSDEVYQYTGADTGNAAWTDTANWQLIGSGGGGGGAVDDVNGETGSVTLVAGTGIDIDAQAGTGNIEITATGGGGGGSTDGEDLSLIVRENPYSSAGDHEGTVLKLAPVGTLGRVHFWNGTNWVRTNADAEATSSGLLCLGTADSGDALVKGIMQLGFVPGLVGDVLYLSKTDGNLTHDVSSFASGDIIRVCGYNLGGSKVYFDPSPDWIEIA